MVNLLPSQRSAIVGAIDPDAYSTGDESTGWIAAKDFHNFMAVVMAGALGTNATIDAKLEQAKDDSGTDAEDITGKAITQLSQADTDESDKQAIINLAQGEISDGFTHFRLTITVGTATSDAAGLVFGCDERYGPADENDAASVAEIVA